MQARSPKPRTWSARGPPSTAPPPGILDSFLSVRQRTPMCAQAYEFGFHDYHSYAHVRGCAPVLVSELVSYHGTLGI